MSPAFAGGFLTTGPPGKSKQGYSCCHFTDEEMEAQSLSQSKSKHSAAQALQVYLHWVPKNPDPQYGGLSERTCRLQQS